MKDYLFTSESVCAGHPDKICDQISDAIVDEVLRQDPNGRVAIETLVTKNRVILAGEVSARVQINYRSIIKKQIKRLGYTDPSFEFTSDSPIDVHIHTQSEEIAKGVKKKGAGDQGMMFGFACSDTTRFMPLPITLAHALTKAIDKTREQHILPYLRPDGKSQVTISYKNGKPYKVTKVVIAVPHKESIDLSQVKEDIYIHIVKSVLGQYGFSLKQKDLIVNGTGVWHKGGPASDTGLTGRKIIVDTYGGFARVGGGCFSGKDPTKVDRSGAYAARFLAKNLVAHRLADKVEVSLAYHIGAKKPIMQEVETFETEKVSKKVILDFMHSILNTSVHGIIETLGLQKPIYLPTAAYGHFGRDEFPWEKIVKYV